MRTKFDKKSDGDDSGSRKCKHGYSGVSGGIWQGLHSAGLWNQSGLNYRQDVSTFNLLY